MKREPNRYRRARELAGLSVPQAIKLIGVNDRHSFEFFEKNTDRRVAEDCERRMADVYGCSVEWLRGDEIPVPRRLTPKPIALGARRSQGHLNGLLSEYTSRRIAEALGESAIESPAPVTREPGPHIEEHW